jgi:hypothetical protein
MSQIAAVPLYRPVSTCFSDPESKKFNHLVMISFLLRAREAGGCSRRSKAAGFTRARRASSTRRTLQPMRDFSCRLAADAAKRNIRLYR